MSSSRLSPPSFIIRTSPRPLIGAYRNATSIASQHRQTVITWLDRLQSLCTHRAQQAPPQIRSILIRVLVNVGDSRMIRPRSKDPRTTREPLRASSGLEGTPVSPNTFVDSEIDPYPDMPSPLGSLESCDQLIKGQRRCVVGQDAKDGRGECFCR